MKGIRRCSLMPKEPKTFSFNIQALDDIKALFDELLQRGVIRKCRHCGNLFIPANKGHKEFCSTQHRKNGLQAEWRASVNTGVVIPRAKGRPRKIQS